MKLVRRKYYILVLLGLLFAAPGISAYIFYLHPSWLGTVTTNKGRLLNPPILLAHTKLNSKWLLALWSPGACEQNCVAELDKLARIRLALGRHLYKVQPQLLLDANAPPLAAPLAQALQEQDIHITRLSQEERKNMSVLKDNLAIFIVNPDAYLVLAYQPNVKPQDIFHDLKQLVTK